MSDVFYRCLGLDLFIFAFLLFDSVYSFAGDLERLFLVLREKTAVRRMKSRDGEPPGAAPVVPDVQPADPPVGAQPLPDIPLPVVSAARGLKRVPSDDHGQSKRR